MFKATKSLFLTTALIFFLSTVGALSAAAISWNENVDGDLDYFSAFDLDEGLNTFTGSQFWDQTISSSFYDLDHFDFNLATGLQLDSVTYELTGFTYNDANTTYGEYASSAFSLLDSTNSTLGQTHTLLLSASGPIQFFENTLPLSAGSYLFKNSSIGISNGDAWYADYRLTFDVSTSNPVPEPSTILLLGSGLLGLGWYGRKRKKA